VLRLKSGVDHGEFCPRAGISQVLAQQSRLEYGVTLMQSQPAHITETQGLLEGQHPA